MSTARNLRVAATADTSNLEQGMARARKSVAGFSEDVARSSQRTSASFDAVAKKSEGISKGLQLATVAAFRLGGSFDSMAGGIAKGIGDTIAMTKAFGPLGLAFGAVTSAIDIFTSSSRRAREEQERAAAAAAKQVEEQKKRDESYRSASKVISEQVELLQAQNAEEERLIRNRRERAKLVETHGAQRGGTLADRLEGAQEARTKREEEAAYLKALKDEEDLQRRLNDERKKATDEYRSHLRDRQMALEYDAEHVKRLQEAERLDEVAAKHGQETAKWEEEILKTERAREEVATRLATLKEHQVAAAKSIAKAAMEAAKAEEAAAKKSAAEREKTQLALNRDAEGKRATANDAWMRRDEADANLSGYRKDKRRRDYQTARMGGFFEDGEFYEERPSDRRRRDREERKARHRAFEASNRRGNLSFGLFGRQPSGSTMRRRRQADPTEQALEADAGDASAAAAAAEEAAQAAEKAAQGFAALEAPMQGLAQSGAAIAETATRMEPIVQTASDSLGKSNDALSAVSTSMSSVAQLASKQGQIIQKLKTDVDALKQALAWVGKAA